jgi:predicted  nucleic acid-binding Zn-ribbon protein
MSVLGAMFGRSKNLGDIKVTELQQEKIRLEVSEQSFSKQLREMEGQKARAFKDAVDSKGSRVDDRIVARRIQGLGANINDLERQASDASQKLMALDRMIRAKERQKQLEQQGLWSSIAKMSLEELDDTLTGMTVKDRAEQQRIGEINRILGVDESMLSASEPGEIRDILEHIESARESGLVDQELESLNKNSQEDSYRV